MKVKVFFTAFSLYSCAQLYASWIEKNPDVEVVSTIGADNTIVVTYRDPYSSPTQTL
jgi:arginine repressor